MATVTVTYNPRTGLSVSKDPVVVTSQPEDINWVWTDPDFDVTGIVVHGPSTEFPSPPMSSPGKITINDKNLKKGTYKYDVIAFDKTRHIVVRLDPEIQNSGSTGPRRPDDPEPVTS